MIGFTEEQIIVYGLPALFFISLLASSILPLGSEWLLAAIVIQQHEIVPAVMIATIGNSLGALTTYGLGFVGKDFITERLLKIKPDRLKKSERLFKRYGIWSLLFSWLPIIGDPLCFVAGLLRTGMLPFLVPVVVGKSLRYWLVAILATWSTLGG